MPLTQILKYQTIDMKVFSLDKDFRASQESQRLQYYYGKYKEHKDALDQVHKEAMEAMQLFSKSTLKIKDGQDLENYIDEDLSKIDDLSDLDLYNKSLNQYEEFIVSLEREVNRLTKRLFEIKSTANNLQETLKDFRNKTRIQKTIFDKKQKEIAQEVRPYLIELKQLQQEIEPKLMKKYLALRKERTMPAIVEYVDGNCIGCGIHIAIEVDNKLQKKGDYAECPECRRIVYRP